MDQFFRDGVPQYQFFRDGVAHADDEMTFRYQIKKAKD